MLLLCPFCPHEDGTGTITAGSAYPVHNRTQTENCVTKPRFYPQKGVSTMKREDVKNKITGITEEQPNWLMQENGSDITREKFLSTLSLRRATTCYCSGSLICNFYPRSPCGERHVLACGPCRIANFYPRSPCGERHPAFLVLKVLSLFLSTLSLRRATHLIYFWLLCHMISIHALLAESDHRIKSALTRKK